MHPGRSTCLAPTQTVSVDELKSIAKRIRRHIVQMTAAANSGHPGGSLSSVEIATALYFFPVEDLMTFRKLGGKLQGHTIMHKPPGVEMSAGALGMGLSFSLGHALAGRLDGRDYRVFCLLSDGDCQEGQTWEAAMASAHHQAENLIAIVDRNHIQNDGFSDYQRFPDGNGRRPQRPGGWVLKDGHTANIMNLEPLEDKWKAFGWSTQHIDGHDFEAIINALEAAKAHTGGPSIVICETIKGKGVSFMENNPDFHGKAPSPEQLEQALKELAD